MCDLLNFSGTVEVSACASQVLIASQFLLHHQELSLQRVDCSAECLLRALSLLAVTRSCTSPLSKLGCVFCLNCHQFVRGRSLVNIVWAGMLLL